MSDGPESLDETTSAGILRAGRGIFVLGSALTALLAAVLVWLVFARSGDVSVMKNTALAAFAAVAIFMAGFSVAVRRVVGPLARRVDAAEREGLLLAAAMAQARDMVFIASGPEPSRLTISFANASMERELGYAPGELIGKAPSIAFGRRTDKATIARIAELLAQGADAEGEILAYRKDGTAFWSEWRGRAVADLPGGEPTWVAIGRNTDLRRRHEDELARLSAAVEHASDAIYIYSMREGDELPALRYLNAAATALSGFRIADPQARMRRFDPNATAHIAEIAATMRSGKSWHDWVKMRRADGVAYWADVHLKPLQDRSGNFTQWVSIERDVTDEVERERRLATDFSAPSTRRNSKAAMRLRRASGRSATAPKRSSCWNASTPARRGTFGSTRSLPPGAMPWPKARPCVRTSCR